MLIISTLTSAIAELFHSIYQVKLSLFLTHKKTHLMAGVVNSYCMVFVLQISFQLMSSITVYSYLVINLLQCLSHSVLAGLDVIHLPV